MTYDWTKEVRESLEKATPGPWRIGHISEIKEDAADIDSDDGAIADNVYGAANRTFLLNAPTDIANLLAEREVLREALEDVSLLDCSAKEFGCTKEESKCLNCALKWKAEEALAWKPKEEEKTNE